LFFLGILSAIVAARIESMFFKILPNSVFDTFTKYFFGARPNQIEDIFIIILLTFFFIAPLEEFLKFLTIKLAVQNKPEYLDQTIDGIKFGIVVGLGFAVIENGIYFSRAFALLYGQNVFLINLFLLRFFIPTLAHSLYTGILGYYFGLSRSYRLYGRHFLLEGIFFAIFAHAIFNLFILIDLEYLSIIILLTLLLLMFKWYRDRKNFEYSIRRGNQLVKPPFLAERVEFESILSKNKVTLGFIKKLNICPFCFKKRDPQKKICYYCGNTFG